jgi:hypothetical protein
MLEKEFMQETRKLSELVGVGKATLLDFRVLGIGTVSELALRQPRELYDELCEKTGAIHDICALDVFTAAVAQARDPNLPKEKRNWWYWSKVRKEERG